MSKPELSGEKKEKLQQKINQELLYIETEENIIENLDFIAQTE